MNADPAPMMRTQHLPARIAAHLGAQITKGTLTPGDRLPTENALAVTYGVSRTVIREAIAQLRNEGLIETRQGVGAFVSDRPARHIRLDDGGRMEAHAFRDLFQLRLPLEIEAAGLAAANHDADHLAQLDRAIARMADPGDSDAVPADLDFHRIIAQATGNDYFVQFLGAISDRILHSIVQSRERMPADRIATFLLCEHGALRDAIAARDPLRARDAMRDHMVQSAARVGLVLDIYS